MQFKSLTKIVCLLSVAAMSGGSLFAAERGVPVRGCASETSDWNFPSEASQLLKEIRSATYRLTANAENLKSFGPGGVGWQGHANELTQIREQVNTVGERIQRLQAIRHVIAPWQREAVDSVTPVAVTLASHTQAAIEYLNDNRNYLWSETYQDHLKTMASRAGELKKSVGLHLELAETLEKIEGLRGSVASLGS